MSVYGMNKFCHELKTEANRAAYRQDPEGSMARYDLAPEEREAINNGDYPRLFSMGLNIYLLVVLTGLRGISLGQLGELMRTGRPAGPVQAGS